MLANQNIANSLWNLLDIFIYPVLFFLSTPFFLNALGQTGFGIWMLVISIMVSMQLFNLGIGNAVLKNISAYIGNDDDVAKQGMINGALSFTCILFLLCLILGLFGYFLVMEFNLFHIEPAARKTCALCFLIAGYLVGVKFFEQIFTNYFKAMECFKLAALLGSGNRLLSLLVNIILLFFFYMDIVRVLLVIAMVNTIFIILGCFIQRKTMPGYLFRFQFKIPTHEASFAMLAWLQSVCIILTFQSDRFFVVSYFGLVALSYYALTATMFNHLHMGLNAILPWLAPKFTKMQVRQVDSNDAYKAAGFIINSVSILILLTLSLCYPIVFNWILGPKTAGEIEVYTKYFIVFEAFFALGILPGYYLNAVGFERAYFYFVLIFCGVSILSMFMCIQLFETPMAVLYGLVISSAVGMACLNIMVDRFLTGRYVLFNSIGMILPPLLLSAFVLTNGGVLKIFTGIAVVGLVYFYNVKGKKQQLIRLLRL